MDRPRLLEARCVIVGRLQGQPRRGHARTMTTAYLPSTSRWQALRLATADTSYVPLSLQQNYLWMLLISQAIFSPRFLAFLMPA